MKTAIFALLASSALLSAQPMKPEFHYTTFIAKPAKEVWSALTQKKIIDQYFMAPAHTLELKEGGRISYGGDDCGTGGAQVPGAFVQVRWFR